MAIFWANTNTESNSVGTLVVRSLWALLVLVGYNSVVYVAKANRYTEVLSQFMKPLRVY